MSHLQLVTTFMGDLFYDIIYTASIDALPTPCSIWPDGWLGGAWIVAVAGASRG